MDSLSALDPLSWEPDYLREHPAYAAGNALGWLYRGDKQAATTYPLTGRLYLSNSGWLLLSVPNALVRGVYDAMSEPGVELPTAGVWALSDKKELLNAHISVMTAEEVQQVGADKINERGHMFGYTLGALKEIAPAGSGAINKIWAIQVSAPGLSALRKSYGLEALPNGDQPFHITVAVRRKGVLLDNGKAKGYETSAEAAEGQRFSNPISRGALKAAAADDTTYECNCSGACTCPDTCVCKTTNCCGGSKLAAEKQTANALSRSGQKDQLPGGEADNLPDREFSTPALAEGAKHEHEHTDNDQIAREIAKDHLSEDPRYYEKVKEIEKASYAGAGTGSVYAQQFRNLLNFREPFKYDHNKPVFQNVTDHLLKAKQRGDFIISARNKAHMYRSQLDPNYRYQMAQAAINGTLPQMNTTDKIVQMYGNDIFDTIGRWGKK